MFRHVKKGGGRTYQRAISDPLSYRWSFELSFPHAVNYTTLTFVGGNSICDLVYEECCTVAHVTAMQSLAGCMNSCQSKSSRFSWFRSKSLFGKKLSIVDPAAEPVVARVVG